MITKYISEELKNDIYKLFDRIENDSVVLHTDLSRLEGFVNPLKKQETLDELLKIIIDASSNRTIYFPTFNYDFCRTGIYDVKKSICQIGAFNEFARKKTDFKRTYTPIFNFIVYNSKDNCFEPVKNVFGKESIFHKFVRDNSAYCMFGATIGANTFMYHIEEMSNIGYRYIKTFSGKIIKENSEIQDFTIEYRVRPRIKGNFTVSDEFIDYDYQGYQSNLEKEGLLNRAKLSNKETIWYSVSETYKFWMNQFKQNELYFLTPKSQENVKKLYEHFGYPLTYEKIEL